MLVELGVDCRHALADGSHQGVVVRRQADAWAPGVDDRVEVSALGDVDTRIAEALEG